MNAPSAPDAPPPHPSASPGHFRRNEPAPTPPNGALAHDGATHAINAHFPPRAGKISALALMPSETYELVYTPAERAALDGMVTFIAPRVSTTAALKPDADFAHAEALFTGWGTPKIDASVLAALPGVRVVFHAGGSVKFLTSDELWQRGVRLTSAARVNAIPVAEFTLAQIILGLKQVWSTARATRNARTFVRHDAITASAYGSTVGLLSLGLIGRMVATRLQSLDVRVIGYDPFISAQEAASLGVELCSLEDVFARSHVVSCHTPLLEETHHLLRGPHFESMKPHATFINTARGPIVHEPELIAVLQHRPDLFAVLDVTDPEPPRPESPLYSLPNVLLTPHLSGSVGPECRRMGQMMIDEVRRYLSGQPLLGEVRREQLSTLA
jgi:phosphoglycerate dehydrogenase-like enzyme